MRLKMNSPFNILVQTFPKDSEKAVLR